jgi:transposase
MDVIGEEMSERLDVIPAKLNNFDTPAPASQLACERIVEAPAPGHLIKSGLSTEDMADSDLVD